jgi:hypothetical protein
MNADSEDGRVVPRAVPAASFVHPPSPVRSPQGCDSGKWVTQPAWLWAAPLTGPARLTRALLAQTETLPLVGQSVRW